ncbi:MAG TPA: BMP family ABC transporter substrate-binding protein [Paracoccaceae bacterium]|nr:BMP family ABC transporter substrate-binding protein [Paracoccaceae bacterium]
MKTLAFLAGATALAVALAGPAAAQDESLKVGFIYVGPIGDFGWTHQHDLGRLALEEEYGDRVETTYVESVPEGADAERVIRQMAQSGHDLIFTTSFGFMNATANVARQFPDVKFEHATGYTRLDNMATYDARFYEGRHVAGIIAARMTESNIIGYIAAYPIPEVLQGINSAFLAARSVNPDVEFRIIWANTWFDPALEADAAQTLIEQGADVIFQHTDSTAAMAVAEEAGIYAIGQASDMREFGPTAQLTAIVDNWAPYYIERVGQVMNGTWEATEVWGGLGTGMVQMAEFNEAIPEEVAEEAMAAAEAIAAGELHPFTGPINRQDGSPWLAEGETAPDDDLRGMDFFVEGITATIPN